MVISSIINYDRSRFMYNTLIVMHYMNRANFKGRWLFKSLHLRSAPQEFASGMEEN